MISKPLDRKERSGRRNEQREESQLKIKPWPIDGGRSDVFAQKKAYDTHGKKIG